MKVEREANMTADSTMKTDFRLPTDAKWSAPRAVADGGGGTIIATAVVEASPERTFQALTTNEVERWWGHSDFYRQTDWKADLRVCGEWSVTVRFADGSTNGGSGEFAEIDAPRKLVMTRKFEKHPLLGTRETTITYRLDPLANGTRVTVREEGFIGRSEAAYGNAEHWERVLAWLNIYLKETTMKQEDYHSSITANISATEAVERIGRVSDWWTAGVQGNSRNVGDAFTVRFGETFVTFKVVEVIPDKRIVWLVTDCNLHWIKNRTEWKGTKVAWDVLPENGVSRISMTHFGLVPGMECYNDCTSGWNFYVTESLFKLLTAGKGLPDRERSKGQNKPHN
jgi:uncharacterized protein YndB with AHSA1/START domain